MNIHVLYARFESARGPEDAEARELSEILEQCVSNAPIPRNIRDGHSREKR